MFSKFAAVSSAEARIFIDGIKRLLDPKGKYKEWGKPGKIPRFVDKLAEAGLLELYNDMESFVFESEALEEVIRNRD